MESQFLESEDRNLAISFCRMTATGRTAIETRFAVKLGCLGTFGTIKRELRRLPPSGPSSDISWRNAILAVRPKGMIKAGQIWYCRISMSTEQLQSVFPPTGARILQVNKQPRDHKSQAALEEYKKIYPDESSRIGVGQDSQLTQLNEALKRVRKEPISKATFKRLVAKKLI